MHSAFVGREQQLATIGNLVKAKQGGVYAVKGNPGIGKSTLLAHIAGLYKDKGQVFVDLNDLPPLQTAVEFLQFFAEHATGLKHTQEALAKIKATYKTAVELAAPYKGVLKETGLLAAEEFSPDDLTNAEKSKLSGIASILWKLGTVLWGRKQESDKTKLGDPELYLLNALKKDCRQQPLIFIDTYERLQAASDINVQKIVSHFSHLNKRFDPSKESLGLQDWIERFLPFLQQCGALIFIAGRKTGYWQAQSDSLERLEDNEILALAGSSQHADLQQAVADQPQVLLSILKPLSFDGIPLWLQVAINFICQELDNGKSMSQLAAMDNLNSYFETPITDVDLNTANIEQASCKLALFKRVMQHNLEIADRAWQMALPRRLDKAVLRILFGEQAETMRHAFVNAGLLPAIRIVNDEQAFHLHNEIRDLLLAYARYQKGPETEENKTLHRKLADFFAERYQRQPQMQWFLERLYHQLMMDHDANLEHISDPRLLTTMTLDLQAEKQYSKMVQVLLRQLHIQPDYGNIWACLGGALYNLSLPSEAIAALSTQVDLHPEDEEAWNTLGIVQFAQGKVKDAVDSFIRQLTINPKHDGAWFHLGIVLLELRLPNEAVAAFRAQVAVKPDHEQAWGMLGYALNEQGKLEYAIDAYQRQIAIDPKHKSIWHNLGTALYEQGKFKEAVDAYHQQLDINPKNELTWYYLVKTLHDQGKFEEAIDAYRQLLAINPEHEMAWFSLGNVLHKQSKVSLKKR